MTEMAACGCHLIVFTTGRGSVVGHAVSPVIKVASNSEMYRRLSGDMDVDAGVAVQTPDGLQVVAEEIARVVIRSAAGDLTRAEVLGHMENYISDGYFKQGLDICQSPREVEKT
jgi:altronate hydrolase